MIVFSQQHYLSTTPNTICLTNSFGEFFYCHRDTYDKAVILSDRYTHESLSKLLPETQDAELLLKMAEEFPSPLKILVPFLNLVKEPLEGLSIDLAAGVLHTISNSIDLRRYVKVSPELRSEVSFSLLVTEEHLMAWDKFFISSVPYSEVLNRTSFSATSNPAPVEEIGDPDSLDDEDRAFFASWDAPATEEVVEVAVPVIPEVESPKATIKEMFRRRGE